MGISSGPGTLSDGKLAERVSGPGLVHEAVRSDPEFRPPLLFILPPPSSAPPPPPLPGSPSGNHEPPGFQAQILRFQMFGKFLHLGHSSGVREFHLGGKTAEILPPKSK